MNKIPLLDILGEKPLLIDGAMGTEIQKLHPASTDFPDGHDGFNDGLVLTHPEWIEQIHRNYLDAGADCIETNSFGSSVIKLAEYNMSDDTIKLNKTIASLATRVVSEYDTPKYILGSMGPSGLLPSSNDPDLGQTPLEEIKNSFYLQALGLIEGGVDALLIETSQDILEVKMAILASHMAMKKIDKRVALIANTTLDQFGKMLLGTSIQSAYTTVSGMGIDIFGLNCSTGPIEMEQSIRWLDENTSHNLLVVPNAGMPVNQDGVAVYKMDPTNLASKMAEFLSSYPNIKLIGGCCGTTPQHITQLRTILDESIGN